MVNCSICSKELKFLNTPNFGSGKLNDGNQICSDCLKKINKKDPKVAFKLKSYNLNQIMEILEKEIIVDKKVDIIDPRLDEITEQIKKLKPSNNKFYINLKEVKELPNILSKNEEVLDLVQGFYNKGNGLLVATNRRLVFIDKGLIFGLKVEDFPLDKISSIQYETGIIFAKIKIHTTSNVAEIDNVEKSTAREFAEFVREYISKPKEPQNIIIQNSIEPSVLDQLEKLAKLKEIGVLSEEEFAEQKLKLLNKL